MLPSEQEREYKRVMDEELEADYLAIMKKLDTPEFRREVVRTRKLKVQLDCGHWIDGSETYRYHVHKFPGEPLVQRTDCESCAREDLRF